MKPLTKEQFYQLWKEKAHDKPIPSFKVVKAFSHQDDVAKPMDERRSCIGVYPSELSGATPKLYFQVINNSGDLWAENPHLYMLSKSRFNSLVESGIAVMSKFKKGKWEVPIDRCTIPMNHAQLEEFLDGESNFFQDVNLVNGLASELRMEFRRFQMAVEGIIRKYEV